LNGCNEEPCVKQFRFQYVSNKNGSFMSDDLG
jgi:hypothetical protein